MHDKPDTTRSNHLPEGSEENGDACSPDPAAPTASKDASVGPVASGTVDGRPVALLRHRIGEFAEVMFIDSGKLAHIQWSEYQPNVPITDGVSQPVGVLVSGKTGATTTISEDAMICPDCGTALLHQPRRRA